MARHSFNHVSTRKRADHKMRPQVVRPATAGKAHQSSRSGIPRKVHGTKMGTFFEGDALRLLESRTFRSYRGRVNLIFTSPPFPLNEKKTYGNLKGEAYLDWTAQAAAIFWELLAPNGSLVVEIGNSWEPGRPVQSLLTIQALMSFLGRDCKRMQLCQQFVCYNPSRLPGPAQWVTVEKIRVTDSFTHVWWLSKTDRPKANVRRVLRPYSSDMQKLLVRGSYNAGKRPSEHVVSANGFNANNGGSIPHNFLETEPIDPAREPRLPNAFSFGNTANSGHFVDACKSAGITPHPARMPLGLPAFFIEFLTEPGDVVLDPFAGSNTTGFMAERLGRRWLSVEIQQDYATQAKIRLADPNLKVKKSTTPSA
jgi:DNA modification methylase